MQQEAGFGRIFAELFAILSRAGREVALYTVVVGGATALGVLTGLTEQTPNALNYGFSVDASDSPQGALFQLLVLVLNVVATYLLLKRFLAAAGRSHDERNRFWGYVGMSILMAIGIVFGLLLLIVPGVILLVRWSASSGFLLGAGQGVTESLTSSWHATKGHGWPIFFAGIVMFIGVMVVAGVLGALAVIGGSTLVELVSALVEAAAGAVFAAFGIAIYSMVHDDAREVSAVFA